MMGRGGVQKGYYGRNGAKAPNLPYSHVEKSKLQRSDESGKTSFSCYNGDRSYPNAEKAGSVLCTKFILNAASASKSITRETSRIQGILDTALAGRERKQS